MVDIRIPIGLMFSILGVLITGYGLFTLSNAEMYGKSLGINLNIIMGILMLIFGLIMLYFAWKKKKTKLKQQ
jgi:protein-S-isoprenylcysteine O-methyltransferase Ste14